MMNMKKKIGLSFTKTSFDHYLQWLSPPNLPDNMELVMLSFEKDNTEDIYACDGFVLSGGVDIDPSFYGGVAQYANRPAAFQKVRDEFEEKIFWYSQANDLPLLAICRGLQLVNILQEGTLQQDLGDLNAGHQKGKHADSQHLVSVEEGSLLHDITGTGVGTVNSAHHQAIADLGRGLAVNCRAQDGTIEGIEWADKTGKGFMLGVQWHPERMVGQHGQDSPFAHSIRTRFFQEVNQTNSNS